MRIVLVVKVRIQKLAAVGELWRLVTVSQRIKQIFLRVISERTELFRGI